jgi:Transcription-repair coupling factor (superfamily II helicase)
MHHEFDVLVATTIIENGLDIPLANTLVVNRADKFGLSSFISCAVESADPIGVLTPTF